MIEHVYKNIYLGNRKDASNWALLASYQIGALVNCAQELPVATKQALPYFHLKIIPGHRFTRDELESLMMFYNTWKHESILVHCQVGMERSPAVVIAMLVAMGFSFDYAFEIVHRARTEVKIKIYDSVKESLWEIFGR